MTFAAWDFAPIFSADKQEPFDYIAGHGLAEKSSKRR
jgi:hypothetical protein